MNFKCLFFIAILLSCLHAKEKQPNIIVIFIDDMGWGDFSCFGNKDAQTPNINSLAEEGISFEQFYVNSPICSPSRSFRQDNTHFVGASPHIWLIKKSIKNGHAAMARPRPC